MSKLPQISDAEWDVMKVVWKQPGCSAADVIDALSQRRPWGPATIKTLLNRLTKKGALSYEKNGNSYRYTATSSEDEMRNSESRNFLDRVFDGALAPFVAHFVKAQSLSKEEIRQLEAILRQGKDRK